MVDYINPNNPEYYSENDSLTIMAAIDAACRLGLRKVKIPRYNARTQKNEWRIPSAIALPDDFTLILDNCYMVQETGVYDRMFRNSRSEEVPRSLETEQHNIAVIGEGNVILDGGEHNHLTERTAGKYGLPHPSFNNMFFWINVDGLRVENVHIRNHRWWAMNHYFCRNVVLKNINFYADPHVPNMDGIDLRVGCNHFTLENITGRTGDDLVAFSALATEAASRKMTGKDPDIHDCTLRNLKADPWFAAVLRLLNQDGSCIYNIFADTLMDSGPFTNKKRAKCGVRFGSRLYYKKRVSNSDELHDIVIKNLTSKGEYALFLEGASSDVSVENVHTYSDIISLMGSAAEDTPPYEVRNFRVDHAFYAPGFTPNNLGAFIGRAAKNSSVCKLTKLKGSIKVSDLHSDSIKLRSQGTGITISEPDLDAVFENADFMNLDRICDIPAGAHLSLNGETIRGRSQNE